MDSEVLDGGLVIRRRRGFISELLVVFWVWDGGADGGGSPEMAEPKNITAGLISPMVFFGLMREVQEHFGRGERSRWEK